MSFMKTFEGDVEKVVNELGVAFKGATTKAEGAVHEFIGYLSSELRTIAGSAKKLVLKVETEGHFNDDGTGQVTVRVTSQDALLAPAVSPAAAAAPASNPAAEPAVGEGAGVPATEAPKQS